jgi:hypothetical protein
MWLKLLYKIKEIWASLFSAKEVEEAPLFVATVFKNEAPFLKEWLDFHLSQGVKKFYLADNFSADNAAAVLAPYIAAGQVFLQQTLSSKMNTRLQAQELNRLLKIVNLVEGKNVWLAIIDIDEFLFHPNGQKLVMILNRFKGERLAAVFVNWLMFGTSRLPTLDASQSMLKQLTWRAHKSLGEHKMGKPIVYLANVLGFLEGPHLPFRRGDSKIVYSNGQGYSAKNPQIEHEPLRINHYWYRSEAYYQGEKKRKRLVFGDERSGKRELDHLRACNYEEDKTILELLK